MRLNYPNHPHGIFPWHYQAPVCGGVLNRACITQLPKPVIPPRTDRGNGISVELTSFGCGVRYNLKHVRPAAIHHTPHQSKRAENAHAPDRPLEINNQLETFFCYR